MAKREAPTPSYLRRPFVNPPEYFPRDSNGLVELSAYDPYLVDDPDDAPIEMTEEQRSVWLWQHLYFQRPFYQQQWEELDFMRDKLLMSFSNIPYNQLAMRRKKEQEVHATHEEHVFPPDPEVMKRSMVDFRHFDILGAAAVGRRIALVPEALSNLLPSNGLPKKVLDLSPLETAKLFDEEMERALETLKTPLVTPQRVVTGVVRRTARMLNNEILNNESRRRVDEDPVYYPVRLRTREYLYTLSKEILRGTLSVVSVDERERRDDNSTGPDEFEEAA